MKAVLCKAFGPASSLVLEEIASPSPAKNEILLDVHAAGVNFPDTLIIEGKYQFKPPFPFSPGGEAAGVVAAVGEKVAHVRPGDRVMALTGWGSFAEQVKVPGYNVMPIPEGMDFASGSIPSLPANLTLLKGASLVGVFWGSFAQRQPQDNADNFRQLFAWHAEGKLKPLVSQRFPLERAGDAIDALGQRKAVGKVVVEVR
ncbi:TPA: zinc-binding dehydrogenase [Pseudomonas aeruginosa]